MGHCLVSCPVSCLYGDVVVKGAPRLEGILGLFSDSPGGIIRLHQMTSSQALLLLHRNSLPRRIVLLHGTPGCMHVMVTSQLPSEILVEKKALTEEGGHVERK